MKKHFVNNLRSGKTACGKSVVLVCAARAASFTRRGTTCLKCLHASDGRRKRNK